MLTRKSLPPGVPFLARLAIVVATPPVVVFVASRLLAVYHVGLPLWAWLVAGALSGPVALTARIWSKYRSFRRRADRAGAALPPALEGREIGNFDTLRGIIEAFKTGYPSDMFDYGFGDLPVHGVTVPQTDTFQYNVFWDMGIVTKDPNVVKAVLATDFPNFEKGEMFHQYTDSLFGTGVFNSDGDLWKFHRSMSRPFFKKERISHFEIFERHADLALSMIRERARSDAALNFQELIARFTLDSATEFLFGNCVHSLNAPLPHPHGEALFGAEVKADRTIKERFPEAFSTAQRLVAERPRIGWVWPIMEVFKSKTDEHMAVVDAFIEPLLQEALRKKDERVKAGETFDVKESQDDETLLDHLVKQTSDLQILHDETLNILLAGRDTTAAALTFGVYLLCQHPAVLARLRDEIGGHIGFSRRPTYDDIRDMKYLRAFLNETLRLYPSVPFDIRFAIKDATVPSPDGKPWFIPAKTPVVYSIFNMHRDPKYWGPTADQFDPDRFIDERLNQYLVPNPFIFLPFNAGPRICLGQQFAYNEMSFFIIRLLQNFSSMSLDLSAQPPSARPPPEWKECSGRKAVEEVHPKLHFTLYAEGGLWVKMREADNGIVP
ncbi:cytochrome P450 monooxygenase pc-3 [Epithele typhae]|uniref:cytochrome P450 monooxygenase pc-3 n=1 Tax=Epithele typhae TaxID=378194 RepID=UPI002007FAD7|nr:cytochrome P450 monooxygenase pc-3 [Epithele typhae]KAH9927192.1 cytochrome P450 monooxygenase pc-3 [Epithele typhae]